MKFNLFCYKWDKKTITIIEVFMAVGEAKLQIDYWKRQIQDHGREYVENQYMDLKLGSSVSSIKNGDMLVTYDPVARNELLSCMAEALGYPVTNPIASLHK